MPTNELGSLRRSHAVGTHGPGAIVDFKVGGRGATVSVVAAGLDVWDERAKQKGLANAHVVYEPRLQQKLHVDGFRLAPVAREIAPGVPERSAEKLVGVQFPTWLQCPECHIIDQARGWNIEPGDAARYCGSCSTGRSVAQRAYVVPVRFIVACARGHLDEFPWHWWVRHETQGCKGRLVLRGTEKAGLAGLTLRCVTCSPKDEPPRTMEGCFDLTALAPLGPCRGRRPWLPSDPEACTETPRVLQRGASNLYFPFMESALDIPPWSDSIQKKLEHHWTQLRELSSVDERRQYIKLCKVNDAVGMTADALLKEVEQRLAALDGSTRDTIRFEEFNQFTRHDKAFGARTEFEIRPQPTPPEFASHIARVTAATRLREVRALIGFTRVQPPAGETDLRMAPIQLQRRNWLPAIETRGEGIFIQLDEAAVSSWETGPAAERAARINALYAASLEQRTGRPPERTITPRFLLVHGFAHAVMRQLALDCGYGAASLRERLYVATGSSAMAGLLVYTATPDADGTLGGLARQAKPRFLVPTIERALRGLTWCSSDPLCIEGASSLSHQLNGAACHACLLAPETSCEEFNYLLDRACLIGTPSQPAIGFFSDYLSDVESGGLG